MIRIAIASDHAGFSLKKALKDWLTENHYTIYDYGCHSNEIVDYPDYVYDVLDDTISLRSDYGVLICGSGVGMSIAANRYPKTRAALCYSARLAKLAREHNNANIICLGSVFTSVRLAQEILKTFFTAKFTGGRHELRVKKLESLKI
ncbi:MAG: ribose 5-phosphate isomerase B [Rickettsiaceae bacterium H1]|nr:ribose 5-phosphate isomerase B [Rickettsiaceae bacterium H1]